MKIRNLLEGGLMAAALLAVSESWAAEESNKHSAGAEGERAGLLDISFPGGTLAEFVAYLDKAIQTHVRDATRANFLIADELKKTPVPKVELRSVDVGTLMSAMRVLVGQNYQWQQIGSSTWVAISRPDARKTQAFYIGQLLRRAGEKPAKDEKLRGFTVADITTALETVWQMDSASKPELKYHEDTQLLVIRADLRQIQMAENVLNQLRGAVAEAALQEDQERAKRAVPAGQ